MWDKFRLQRKAKLPAATAAYLIINWFSSVKLATKLWAVTHEHRWIAYFWVLAGRPTASCSVCVSLGLGSTNYIYFSFSNSARTRMYVCVCVWVCPHIVHKITIIIKFCWWKNFSILWRSPATNRKELGPVQMRLLSPPKISARREFESGRNARTGKSREKWIWMPSQGKSFFLATREQHQ